MGERTTLTATIGGKALRGVTVVCAPVGPLTDDFTGQQGWRQSRLTHHHT
jgi:hypothetical protein